MLENVGLGAERYMNLLSARQKLVASNIANADTPDYKTKDIDFRNEFESQLASFQPAVRSSRAAPKGTLTVVSVASCQPEPSSR